MSVKSNSWVIVSKATGKAVYETFNMKLADSVDGNLYAIYTAYDWLGHVNKTIREADAAGVKSIFHT